MATALQTHHLPASTIFLLEGGGEQPFGVGLASKWADALIALGLEPPELFEVYNLEDSEGHACAKLLKKIMVDLGLWPTSQIELLAATRDIAIAAFLRGEMDLQLFADTVFGVACDLRKLIYEDECQAGGLIASEIQAFYEVEHIVDLPNLAGPDLTEVYRKIGLDPSSPESWIIAFLQKNGLVNANRNVVPASWA